MCAAERYVRTNVIRNRTQGMMRKRSAANASARLRRELDAAASTSAASSSDGVRNVQVSERSACELTLESQDNAANSNPHRGDHPERGDRVRGTRALYGLRYASRPLALRLRGPLKK